MSTYKTMMASVNENGNIQYHIAHDIIANSVSGALALAMDNFFGEHGDCEIKKVIIELQQSTRKAVGDIYYGAKHE